MSTNADEEGIKVEMEVDDEGGVGGKDNSDAAASSTEDVTAAAAKGVKDENGNDANPNDKDSSADDVPSDNKIDNIAESSVSGKKRPRSPSEGIHKEDGDATKSKKSEAIVAMLEVKKTEPSLAKDGGSSGTTTRENEKIPVASVAAASQLSSAMGWNGLGSLLNLSLLTNNGNSSTSSSNERSRASRISPAISGSSSGGSSSGSNNNGTLPSKEQVLQAAIKAVNDGPPFVHLSKTDSAPQLKITDSERAGGNDTSGADISPTGTTSDAANDTAAAGTPVATATQTASTPAATLVNDRLACKQGEGEMRGYRMTRASHGVPTGAGNFYYEVIILTPPTARELVKSLPPNVRLGKKLQREMEEALRAEEEEEREQRKLKKDANLANKAPASADGGTPGEGTTPTPKPFKPSASSSNGGSCAFGAHVRLGWSMRTGDLQAPVGYDKWSYGIRDIQGSKIHCSRRDDNWGGEEFGPGDVIGCAISMVSDGTESGNENTSTNNANGASNAGTGQDQDHQPRANENHIRFFKNGFPMGEFVITKGKREGGAAFIIPDGVYYPAISLYMGATVKVNFGPHFIHPPRKLPTGMSSKSSKKKGGSGRSSVFQPVSNLCKAPLSVEDSSAKVVKEQKTLFFRKADNTAQQKRFLELVETEVQIQQDAYQNHRRKHVLDIMQERNRRKLKFDDLEQDEFWTKGGAVSGASSSSSS